MNEQNAIPDNTPPVATVIVSALPPEWWPVEAEADVAQFLSSHRDMAEAITWGHC